MKIFDKHYFSIDQILKTDDGKIIGEYIVQLYQNSKKISIRNQKKLADKVIEIEDPLLTKAAMCLMNDNTNKGVVNENLEKLTNAIIKTKTINYIFHFGMVTDKISSEMQDKLVDAVINSKTEAYYKFSKGDMNSMGNLIAHPQTEYIVQFIKKARNLKDYNIKKLADYMIKSKDIENIIDFFKYVYTHYYISEEESLELEKYVLQFYSKTELAEFLKCTNNKKMIKLIYRDIDTLNKFLKDNENRERKISSFRLENQMYSEAIIGGVKSTSGFVPNWQLRTMGYAKTTGEELAAKYKFVDDNIEKVLNSDRYIKN